MSPSADQLRAGAEAASAALPALMLSAERLAASLTAGAHGQRRAGTGEDFWQYRPATQGDTARSIDWRRSARSDGQFVRDREATDSDLRNQPLTIYMVNLGMTSMNAPLNVRVLDMVGLATPIAARMPRIPGGRIGHDKQLDPAWQAADSGTDLDRLPAFINPLRAKQARAALRTPEIAELLATSREPMSWQRFWANVRYSVGKGRTLTLHDDPGAYLDPATRKAIRRGEDPGESGTQIAWPVTVKTANDPSE